MSNIEYSTLRLDHLNIKLIIEKQASIFMVFYSYFDHYSFVFRVVVVYTFFRDLNIFLANNVLAFKFPYFAIEATLLLWIVKIIYSPYFRVKVFQLSSLNGLFHLLALSLATINDLCN